MMRIALSPRMWLLVGVCALASASAQAAVITFDEPGYNAGSMPPSPWLEEYDNTGYSVQAGIGWEGTQGLVVSDASSVAYDLPTPLTSEMGAVSVSVLFKPEGLPGDWNYGSHGGLLVGYGSLRHGWGDSRELIFRRVAGSDGIYGPGGGWGTPLGSFTPDQWYEITFAVHEDWENMTISAGLVGQPPVSMTTDWNGNDISRVWTLDNDASGRSGVYDNLSIVPEPASLGLAGLGSLVLLARRRRR